MKSIRRVSALVGKFLLKLSSVNEKMKREYYSQRLHGLGIICGDTYVDHPEHITIGKGSFINGGGISLRQRTLK